MSKKATTKTAKSVSAKSSRKTVPTSSALTHNGSSGKSVHRSSSTVKFVAAKTGRVIKSSPVEPRLGRERIQTAVKSYVNRSDSGERFSD